MAAAAHAFGQRDAVKVALRAQPHLHALFARTPHQRKGTGLGREDVAHQAVENARGVDHEACDAVEHQRLRALGDVGAELAVLLVHGLAAHHELLELLGREVGNLAPARKALLFHVQGRQEGGALGKLPLPDVAVFHVLQQRGDGCMGVKELPRQPRARLVHVKVHHAAAAGKAGELFGGALVVVQHDQLGGALVDGGHHLVGKREVEDVHRAALQGRQVVHGLDIAVVQPHVFSLVAVVQPCRQRRTKAIGAIAPVVEDQRRGVVLVGGNQQLQGEYGFLRHGPRLSPGHGKAPSAICAARESSSR